VTEQMNDEEKEKENMIYFLYLIDNFDKNFIYFFLILFLYNFIYAQRNLQ